MPECRGVLGWCWRKCNSVRWQRLQPELPRASRMVRPYQRPGVWCHRPDLMHGIKCDPVEIVMGYDTDHLPIEVIYDTVSGSAQTDGIVGDCIKHGLNVCR